MQERVLLYNNGQSSRGWSLHRNYRRKQSVLCTLSDYIKDFKTPKNSDNSFSKM